jgi:hypothetical protein
MVNLTEVMSAGTIDAVVYIYSDGVCEFEINSSSDDIKVDVQSDGDYELMIDNYVDAIRKFDTIVDGDTLDFYSNMIRSPAQNVAEDDARKQNNNGGEENGAGDGEGGPVPTPLKTVAGVNAAPDESVEEAEQAENVEQTGQQQDGKSQDRQAEKNDNKTINYDNAKQVGGKLSYNQVKTYLETRPNTYTMYDLLTCKWISILNNEISPLDAVDKIKKDEDLNDTIYNPVLNAFYKVNENKKEILNHDEIKKYETQDNIRFSHFEEFWECNNTSKKWIYGRWINGTEYKFKYDNGWLIT